MFWTERMLSTETVTLDVDDNLIKSYPQAVALAIIPKIPGALSCIGSTLVFMEVLADHKAGKGNVIKRILLGMSATELCMSISWVLSTWPSPALDSHAMFAIGNHQTCTAQGAFLQFGACATPVYNGALALCYMLTIRYGWNEARLQSLEWWIHGFVWFLAGGTTIASVMLNLFNNYIVICWISEHPLKCRQSYTLLPGEDSDCIRGDNSAIYAFAFLNIWIWLTYLTILISMACIYNYVSHTERASLYSRRRVSMMKIRLRNKNKSKPQEGHNAQRRYGVLTKMWSSHERVEEQAIRARMTKTKSMARQAWWYVGAYFLTQIPDTICTTLLTSTGFFNYWLFLFTYTLNPGQGLANFLVFIRTRDELNYCASRWVKRVAFGEVFKTFCCKPCFTLLDRTNSRVTQLTYP